MKLLEIIKLVSILVLSCTSCSLASQVFFSQTGAMVIDSAIGFTPYGLLIKHADVSGVVVSSAKFDGLTVGMAGFNGVRVILAEGNGVQVDLAEGNGVQVDLAEVDGVFVNQAEVGVHVKEAAAGVHVNYAEIGFLIDQAGSDGVHVVEAGVDGLFVDKANRWSMNIQGVKSLSATPSGHIAQIYNRSTEGSADVLALKVGETSNPGDGSNFITFFSGDDSPLGRIEGNGSGGVAFLSGGGDFAEFLPIHKNETQFSPGDVVGIIDGKVSLNTSETNKVMVITDRPIVVGNQQENDGNYKMVGFIGQVPVRVRGKVNAGDWIVASDLSDGTGIGIGSAEITLDHKIVGQAWESNNDPGIKRVNTAVGLDHSQAKDLIIKNVKQELKTQKLEISDLQMKNKNLQLQIDELKNAVMALRD